MSVTMILGKAAVGSSQFMHGWIYRSSSSLLICLLLQLVLGLENSAFAQQPAPMAPPPAEEQPVAASSGNYTEQFEIGVSYRMVPEGAMVTSVSVNGPASKMVAPTTKQLTQMEVGDTIQTIDGNPIRSEDDFERALRASKDQGGYVQIRLWDPSKGQAFEYRVHVARILVPLKKSEEGFLLQLGVVPGNIGMRVVDVEPNGAATQLWNDSTAGISINAGDEIVALSGVFIKTIDQLREQLSRLGPKGGVASIDVWNVHTKRTERFSIKAKRIGSSKSPRRIHFLTFAQHGPNDVIHPVTHEWVSALNMMTDVSLMDIDRLKSHIGDDFRGVFSDYIAADCTGSKMITALKNLDAGPDDAIVFYYIGHGAYDDEEHFFNLSESEASSPNVHRSRIRREIEAKNVRFTLFVSESCNSVGDFGPSAIYASETVVDTTGFTRVEDLLLNYRGAVEINSAGRDQLAMVTITDGGVFTRAFTNVLSSPISELDWREARDQIFSLTNSFFVAAKKRVGEERIPPVLRDQLGMTPEVFAFQVSKDSFDFDPGHRRFSPVGPIERVPE